MAYVKVFYKGVSETERLASIEKAMKVFKRQVEREGILKDLRKKEEFVPKSVRRKLKRIEAIKRQRKALRNKMKYNRK